MIRTHLSVGAGVELRGSEDVQHRAELNTQNGGPAMGTILYAVEGKGNDTGTPFISLNSAICSSVSWSAMVASCFVVSKQL